MDSDKPSRRWVVLLFLLVVVVGVVAVLHYRTTRQIGTEVKIGGDSVFYLGDATEADAKKLGAFLQQTGWFRGKRYAAQIRIEDGNRFVSLLVADQHTDNPDALDYAQKAGPALAEIFGPPLTVRICDSWMRVHHAYPVAAAP